MSQNPFSDPGLGSDLLPATQQNKNPFLDPNLGKDSGTTASDLAKSVKVGVQRLPGMVAGLADLPVALATGARPFTAAADALGEATGFQPGKWADETQFSAAHEESKKAVDAAWQDGSAADIAKAYIANPGYTANQVAEALPGMVAGGLAGRVLMGVGRVAAPAARAGGMGPGMPGLAERALGKWAAPVAGGVGEGAMTAGQQMAQYQGEDQQQNALASLGAGVGTGLIGIGAGRVANALGLETAETAMAKAGTGAAKAADEVPLSLKRRVLGGMVSEALLQELPQSAQEQMWQNWADGKPLMDGVARAATEGAIAGGVMGAGANVSDGGAGKRRAQAEQQARQNAEAAAASAEALTQETPQLGYSPLAGTPTVFPDGSVALNSEAALAHRYAPQPMQRPSEAMGIDPSAGPLSKGAAMAVDSGTYMPPADLMQQAAPEEDPIVLQNRDRNSAASIAQMQEIASNPDYLRVGPSRDMTSGAPIVFGDLPPTAVLGRQELVVDGNGQRVGTQYAVVDAGDLIASNHADGSTVAEYATGVRGKLRSVAGNGRTAGLQAAYDRGTAGAYRQELLADAASIGVDAQALAGMQRPVLVRVMGQADVTADMGDRTNITGTQKLSPVEQAANDARRFDIANLAFDEGGNPTAKSIAGFVSSMPVSEQGDMMNPDGSPTRQAVDRLMAATFKQAYDSDELVQLYAQAADPDARAVLSAAADASGVMAALSGTEFDVRQAVADAVKMAVNASRQGLKLSDVLQNADFDMNPEAYPVATFLAQNIRSPKAMAEGLRRWGQLALQQARVAEENKYQGNLLGDPTPTLSRQEILARIGDAYNPTEQAVAGRAQPQEQQAQQEGMAAISGEPSAPVAQVGAAAQESRPRNWRTSMLGAVPVAKALGIEHKGKRLAQVVAEIDARDSERNQLLAQAQQAQAASENVAETSTKEGADPAAVPNFPKPASSARDDVSAPSNNSLPPAATAAQPVARTDVIAAQQQGAQPTAREAQELGAKQRQEAKKQKQRTARQDSATETGLRVGVAPGNAETVTVRDGVVYLGAYEALNYDTGEPVTVAKGSTREQVAQALKEAGVLSSRQRLFGLGERSAEVMFSRKQTDSTQDGTPSNAQAQRQFKETERAYGGRAAYDKAKAAGKTKLTYGQWVQVRTPKFKAWFGDWEAVRAQQRLNAMEPVKVRVPDAWRGLEHAELREKMAQELDRMVREKTEIKHPDVGTIRVGRAGAKKSEGSARDPAKSLVAADIEALIPASIYARSDASRGGDGPDIAGYSTLLARVQVDGVDLVASFTVRHQSDGQWYYNAVALHDAHEKAQDSYGRPDQQAGSSVAPIAGLSEFIRRPLARVNPDAVSKVVDPQTGEPLVVYHGTASDFSEFQKKQATDKEGRRLSMGWGSQKFYFATYPGAASSAAEWAAVSKDRPGNAANVMPVYLRIENPISGAEYASQLSAVVGEGMGRDAAIKALDKRLMAEGYDGIVDEDSGGIAVFDGKQVKSAIGNNGNFDPANPDIRFSFAGQQAATADSFDFQAMRAAVLGSGEGSMSAEEARAILALRRPARATKESVHAALRQLVGGLGLLPNRLGRVVVATAAEIKQDWEPLIGPTGMEASDAGEAQGFYDPKSRTVFLIADHINAGDELGVVAHELMHKHGQAVLGEEGWNKLHGAIEGWARAQPGSMERRVYEEAMERVQASRPDGVNAARYSSQELFPYAVQVALEMGVQPNLLAKPGTVARWLGQVRAALRQVWDKITRKPEQFKSQDLVNLAFGIAQRENPAHAGELDGVVGTSKQLMDAHKARILQGEPVSVLDTKIAPMGAPAIRAWASGLFEQQGGKAHSPVLGDVLLDQRAVRSSIAHGRPNAYKVAAFAAVKDVLEKGALVLSSQHGRDGDSFFVSAPVTIDGTANIVTVLVKRDPNDQRMYLHSVATKESLLNRRVSRTDTENGVERSGSNDAGDSSTVATDGNIGKAAPADVADELNRLLTLDAGLANGPMFSRAAPTPKPGAAGWNAPAASWFDDLIYKLQDKHIDTKRALETIRATGKAIADDRDVYLQEELYHGRAAKRAEDFVNNELQPLMTYMSSVGLKMQDVQDYLHARHAKEANAVIAQRNPKLPDGGSGMTNAEADAVLASFNGIRRTQLARAAAQVDAIVAGTRQTFVDYGLESQDTVDGWAKTFAHYVPLMREQDGDGMAGLGTGQGFSIKGRDVKGRTGSTRKVVDILANIALQRERAIVRGEKNRVATALVGLAKDNPSTLWQVDVVPTRQTLDKKTGMVTTQHDPLYKQRDNVVVAKIPVLDEKTGKVVVKEHAVVFNESDARAMRMATALKNLDAPQMEGLLGATAQVTRYLAAINTQYNPIFGVTNLARDVQGAALNLASTPLAGKQRQVLGQTLSALAGIYSDERSRTKGKGGTASRWAQLWEEFQSMGGQTGYRDQFRTSADRGQALAQALDPSAWTETKWGQFFTVGGRLKVPMEMARKAMAPVFAWLDDYNTAMENGVRLSAYKVALDAGMSKERAASLAKNLTTNFNRKGQSATQVGALYAFFNASVQGTARIGQTLFDMEPGQPKTLRLSSLGKKIVVGGVLLGSMQAVLLAAAGFDDEEPADFVRERNLVIPNPLSDKGYVTIPMPLGFHVLPNLGRIPTEFVLGGFKNPAEHVIRVMGLFADTFNPIGNAGLSMQSLAPTVLDPIAALAENKDFSGRKIAKESFDQVTPGHALARDTATVPAKWLAEGINWLSGGTAHTRGAFSPTPDQIDYLIGQATGGVGRELSKFQQSVVGAAQGDDVPWHKVPALGRFYGDAGSDSAKQSAYYRHLEAVQQHAAEVKGLRLEKKLGEAQAYLQKHPEARWHLAANAAQRNIRELQKQRRELEQQGAPREQVRALEQRIVARMERFSALVQG